MRRKIEIVRVGSHIGCLFVSKLKAGLCFVPLNCLRWELDNSVGVDEVEYVAEGWAKRNGLFNLGAPAHRLFPDAEMPLSASSDRESAEFLDRCGRIELAV